MPADVKEEARKHTKEALNRLVYRMRSDDPQASTRTAMALLDRGCGRATHATAVEDGRPVHYTHSRMGGTQEAKPGIPAAIE